MEFQSPRFFLNAAICSLFFAACLSSSQALSIDTRPQANFGFFSFGELNGATATYGQTITVPAGETVLNSFSFQLDDTMGTVNFAAYVAAWDGLKAAGPILYTSAPQSLTGSPGYQEFVFSTGGLQLTANFTYVLFLSTSMFFDSLPDAAKLAGSLLNPYAGGRFVYSNNGSDFGRLTTNAWDGSANFDTSFTANFSAPNPTQGLTPVPEPASALIGICLAGAVSFSRRWNQNRNFCV